jgi:hypothetical protein
MGGGVFEFRCPPQPQALGFQRPLLFPSTKPSASTPLDCTFLSFLKKNRCDSRIMFGLGGMPSNIQQP